MKKENQKILTPLVTLDTPGKATVEVVILADPVSALPKINKILGPPPPKKRTDGKKYFLCRMAMRFALWEMKPLGSCLLWILKEMNYLIR